MILKILLFISIIFQLIAALIAIRMIRVTKYNLSWILISGALAAMALQRLIEFIQMVFGKEIYFAPDVYVWIGVVTSIFFALGVMLIQKILSYISKVEFKRRQYEKQTLSAVIKAEERERQRVAKEIHDGLGPLLSSLKMNISALSKMNSDPKQRDIIENANTVVDEAVKTLREISNNLSPHRLTDFGVVRALTAFINKIDSVSSSDIVFKTNIKSQRFSSDTELIIYRICCEMINNSIKHALASEIKLDITLKSNKIFITFDDNGRGFDVEAAIGNPNKGMGLSNITSRVESVNGTVVISSALGGGTHIEIIMLEI